MRKKIIALIMLMPLVFALTLFTVGKVASVRVQIPVTGITILTQAEDNILHLELTEYQNDIAFEAEVLPINAYNRNFSSIISRWDEAQDEEEVIEIIDGKIVARGVGKVKLSAVSVDRGWSDSIIVEVSSKKVVSLTPYATTASGENLTLQKNSDGYFMEVDPQTNDKICLSAKISPSNLQDSSVEWESDNVDVAKVNPVNGDLKILLPGSATIKATCKDGINGIIEQKINLIVKPYRATVSGIVIPQLNDGKIVCATGSKTLEFNVMLSGESGAMPIIEGDDVALVDLENLATTPCYGLDAKLLGYNIKLPVKGDMPADNKIDLKVRLSDNEIFESVSFVFLDYTFDVITSYHDKQDGNTIYQKQGSKINYSVLSEVDLQDVNYRWLSATQGIVQSSSADSSKCEFFAQELGEYPITVQAFVNEEDEPILSKNYTVVVVKKVESANFTDNKTYGIEELLSVGDTTLVGKRYHKVNPQLGFKATISGQASNTEYAGDLFDFSSSNEQAVSLISLVDGLEMNINSDGTTIITAKWKYSDYFNSPVVASIKLRGVKDGVAVSNYDELKKAAEDGRKVVLKNDIFLGHENMTTEELLNSSYKMPTSYDWQYYKNKDGIRPEVSYLIEFKNNVYGNGFFINAQNFTMAKDSTQTPLLFKGPLDFVAIPTASVKAQDNISFLVRTEGVVLNNVILLGCSDEKLIDEQNSSLELANLNTTGTVLEIMADCQVLNSRVSNGRTVVRIFGGKDTNGNPVVNEGDLFDIESEKLDVNIEGCILTNAREFILKIGSNRAIATQSETPIKFKKSDASFYEPYVDLNKSDDYFNRRYLINDVTLKNSVLTTSGLFSIGMETHFTGKMLTGSAGIENWTHLAATSYASALRFVGDVKLLDWKKIADVDSSTLIEVTGDNNKELLKFDIPLMLKKVYKTGDAYKNILKEKEGEQYVHGGIAFYGGGLNYSYVDVSQCTNEPQKKYKINLSILAEGIENKDDPIYLQGTMLPLAAGPGDFMFYIYDATSAFDYDIQQNLISQGSAFKVQKADRN